MTPDQQPPTPQQPPAPQGPGNPQPQGQPPAGAGAPGQDNRAAEIYRGLHTAAMKKIFGDPAITRQVVDSLAAGKANPPMTVAHVAMGIIEQVREKVTGIPPDVAYTVAPAVVAELGVLGSAAKVFQFTPQMYQQAVQTLAQQLQQRAPQQAPGAQAPQPPAPDEPEQPGQVDDAAEENQEA